MGEVRVVLVDDQPLVRAGISMLLTGESESTAAISVVGEASDGASGAALVKRIRPDVVLMDIRMPGGDGITATRAIRADTALDGVAVLMLTTFDTDEEVFSALRAGADGYLLKDASPQRLRDAVHAVAGGEPALSPGITRRVMAQAAAAPRVRSEPLLDRLSERERQVLRGVAAGEDNSTIGAALRLSPETVRTYVSRIVGKVGATSRAHLVAIAHRGGLG